MYLRDHSGIVQSLINQSKDEEYFYYLKHKFLGLNILEKKKVDVVKYESMHNKRLVIGGSNLGVVQDIELVVKYPFKIALPYILLALARNANDVICLNKPWLSKVYLTDTLRYYCEDTIDSNPLLKQDETKIYFELNGAKNG